MLSLKLRAENFPHAPPAIPLFDQSGRPNSVKAQTKLPASSQKPWDEAAATRANSKSDAIEATLGQGAVEEFYYVQDFLVGVAHRGAGAELQDAAGVGGGDYLGFGLLH